MKIIMTVSQFGHPHYGSMRRGKVYEVEDKYGERLIRIGRAVAFDGTPDEEHVTHYIEVINEEVPDPVVEPEVKPKRTRKPRAKKAE